MRFLSLTVLTLVLILSACAPGPGMGTQVAPTQTRVVETGNPVTPTPEPGGAAQIQVPAQGERLTLPLHVQASVRDPDQEITATLRWEDGTQLETIFTTLAHPDGGGLLIGSMDWLTEGPPPNPPTQAATLTLRDAEGERLAQQSVNVVSRDDSDTVRVDLYWLLGDGFETAQRRLPQAEELPAETLRELLWGPGPNNLAGFETAIPGPQEVLSYPGRQPDWGVRVRLLGLQVENGAAVPNFSKEMRAYGGGSTRVLSIRSQITQTLLQFEAIERVKIAVEGQTEGVLQP